MIIPLSLSQLYMYTMYRSQGVTYFLEEVSLHLVCIKLVEAMFIISIDFPHCSISETSELHITECCD